MSIRWTSWAQISIDVVQMMKDRLKCNAVPIQLPIGAEDTFSGIIDLVEMKADIYYDDLGKDMREEEIPADMMEQAEEYHRRADRSMLLSRMKS